MMLKISVALTHCPTCLNGLHWERFNLYKQDMSRSELCCSIGTYKKLDPHIYEA
jgi:hypothetical protein